ncbi:putative blue light-inducible protein bli-3 [Phaeomoniella chlamydospora]|uniref:Putative blue light-inducible protein bli-3 n=1 Tax=Phaeomoniella chlamydospora TaxID=158046 RepID=A0A0G2HLE7_PHACM|nr:putative blue light-inducible protein bli-3 [Phaeomoniella chlamydospora]
MPDPLTTSEVNAGNDPSVSKQYDDETPASKRIEDFYSFADSLKICLMGTTRQGLGQVSRAMAVAKREGPDFIFLCNKNSRKFEDLNHSSKVQLTFQDSSSQSWASVTGEAVVTSNSDPRIKDLQSPFVSAWFGDLGDGVHNGKAEDPRMALIEVKSEYIAYWQSQSTKLGFLKEIIESNVTGKVANTGVLRELKGSEIEQARK